MKQVLSSFRRLLPLLPTGARRFLWFYVTLSSALAVLDIVALCCSRSRSPEWSRA